MPTFFIVAPKEVQIMRRRLSLPSLRPEFPQASFPLVCLSLIQLAPNAVSPVPQKSILLRVISLKQGSDGALQNHNLQSQVQTLWRNWILADHSSAASHAPILASGNKTTDRPPRTPRGGLCLGALPSVGSPSPSALLVEPCLFLALAVMSPPLPTVFVPLL